MRFLFYQPFTELILPFTKCLNVNDSSITLKNVPFAITQQSLVHRLFFSEAKKLEVESARQFISNVQSINFTEDSFFYTGDYFLHVIWEFFSETNCFVTHFQETIYSFASTMKKKFNRTTSKVNRRKWKQLYKNIVREFALKCSDLIYQTTKWIHMQQHDNNAGSLFLKLNLYVELRCVLNNSNSPKHHIL